MQELSHPLSSLLLLANTYLTFSFMFSTVLSSKLALKTVEKCFIALNDSQVGVCSWLSSTLAFESLCVSHMRLPQKKKLKYLRQMWRCRHNTKVLYWRKQNNCTTSDRLKRFVFQRCRLLLVVNVKKKHTQKKYTQCKYATLYGYETDARWAIILQAPVLLLYLWINLQT